MKIEDFSNFETKRKEYAQRTFDEFMEREEKENERFDNKFMLFLENTHIENENENKQKVDVYHQKEMKFISIGELQQPPKPNQDSLTRIISKTMKIEGLKNPIKNKSWERVKSIDTNTMVWKIELNEAINLIYNEIHYFEETFNATIDMFKKGFIPFNVVSNLMKNNFVLNEFYIEKLLDCPLTDNDKDYFRDWKNKGIINQDLYNKLLKTITETKKIKEQPKEEIK